MSNQVGQRCVITGRGAVASVGDTAAELFDSLCAGKSGLTAVRRFETADYRMHSGYLIDNRSPDRPANATDWLCRAILEASADAGLDDDLRGIPVVVGTGLRELRSVELAWQGGAGSDIPALDFGPALRERFGCAEVYTFANACSAALHALGFAHDLIEHGGVDKVVVAGVDTVAVSMFAALDFVQPAVDELRPFDGRRKGVLMGDGAAAVVLSRDGAGYGWLRGVGITCDASHVTAPDPTGISAAMHDAHRRAGIRPGDVDLIVAHGTGTVLNDAAEAKALQTVFDGVRPIVTAIKGATGHTSGSSGLLSLVTAVESLRTGLVPPIVGLQTPIDGAAGLRLAAGRVEGAGCRIAQVNAFGFGGVNAVAIVEGGNE